MTAIPLPASWFTMAPIYGDDATVRAILRDPSHPLVELVRRTPADQARELASGVRSAVGSHAQFSYPQEHGALHAAAALAAWIGPAPESVHQDLGGTVTIVRSGLGHRDDQKWHTDSTPWWRPNAMTLLGQVHLAPGFEAPATELLPISKVDDAMAEYPAALHTLRSTPVPWRRNFPERRQFSAPILSLDPPRWVGSVLADLQGTLAEELQDAVDLFRRTIDAMSPVQAVVEPGRLLIFDNRANLHRGPSIEQHLERRLVRVKLGGEPG
ncbi:alpha-ketoglutarate-dependent taurine dioxygenase [Agrococcus sp. UYP33]